MGCYMFMQMMARASFTETGQLLDSGLDLNMQDGIAEYENISKTLAYTSSAAILCFVSYSSLDINKTIKLNLLDLKIFLIEY